ncbi:hypothetical protein [Rossellomorea sp. YZS02]|uniref:hypothetical protein n=1 Tax=Rossellomorea sp. YZS02 TaxID=3097358 RepID=UPI002A172F89|nr:hypothetical protein [Rossellomorea sp. YZS02]MDX8344170.1 hypothetical protein [Rossellomorea sp. YZS02]
MKKNFTYTCSVIIILCAAIFFLFEESDIAGIALGVCFFTQAALTISFFVEEE